MVLETGERPPACERCSCGQVGLPSQGANRLNKVGLRGRHHCWSGAATNTQEMDKRAEQKWMQNN